VGSSRSSIFFLFAGARVLAQCVARTSESAVADLVAVDAVDRIDGNVLYWLIQASAASSGGKPVSIWCPAVTSVMAYVLFGSATMVDRDRGHVCLRTDGCFWSTGARAA